MSSTMTVTTNSITSKTEAPFDLFSSFRFDPELPGVVAKHPEAYPEPLNSPYYLLAYHRDRIVSAGRHFGWTSSFEEGPAWMNGDLKSLEEFLDSRIPDRHRAWRLKLVLHRSGHAWCEISEAGPLNPLNFIVPGEAREQTDSPVWRVYVDSKPTSPSGFTTHKTTARDDYTAARLRCGITSPTQTEEVLMVNTKGEIMEGSITTPYFRQRGASTWVTPPLSSGGNAGTTRRYALDQGFCVEQPVLASELVDGEECYISNGVRGFIRGVVVLTQ